MATFDSQLRSFFEWLWAASWQVSVLILAILFTQWALEKYLSPRTRYALWLLVLVRLALPTLPESPFSLFNLIPQPESVVATVSRSWSEVRAPALNTMDSESLPETREAPLSSSHPAPPVQPESAGSKPSAPVAGPSVAGTAQSDWPSILAILWSIGALVFAAFLVGQSLATRSWYKRLGARTDPDLENLLEECKRQVGIQTPIRLAQAPERTSPALMGYWRPTLLLPEGIVAAIGRENLRYVFTHELAHLRRRDILANWIASFFRLLHWFNPVVWYAFRRMRTDQELACDHQALAYLGQEEKKRYSETILALFERVVLPQRLPGMAGIVEDQSLMKRRIQMIIDFKKPGPVWTAVTLCAVLALGVSTLTGATTTADGSNLSTTSKVITFPNEEVFGSVWIRPVESEGKGTWKYLADARGTINIPPGNEVMFDGMSKNLSGRLSFLANLSPDDIQAIHFERCRLVDSDIAHLTGLTRLRELGLEQCNLTADGMRSVATLTQLEYLDLYLSPIGDEGLRRLAGLTELKWLGIEGTDVTAAGVGSLASMARLEGLNLEDSQLGGGDLSVLAGLSNLKELILRETEVTDDQLSSISELTKLEKLDLNNNPVSDEGISHLNGLTALKHLDLTKTEVTDTGFSLLLPNLSQLETLILEETPITDSGLAALSQLANLQTLDLTGTKVSDAGLIQLAGLSNLRSLKYGNTGITQQGFAQLRNLSEFGNMNPNAPKIGAIFSHTSAHGMTFQGFELGYGFATEQAKSLMRQGFNVFALIDPESEKYDDLRAVLNSLGLEERTMPLTDSESLKTLDAIASAHEGSHRIDSVEAIIEAVRAGVGFYNRSVFCVSYPGYTDQIKSLLGIVNGSYNFRPGDYRCTILAEHPILGFLEVGEPIWIHVQNGYRGMVTGTPLLGPPDAENADFCPMFVNNVGEGRVVCCQWLGDMDDHHYGPYTPDEFMARCVNWAAKQPAGAKWRINESDSQGF